jgi:hypothetical protein
LENLTNKLILKTMQTIQINLTTSPDPITRWKEAKEAFIQEYRSAQGRVEALAARSLEECGQRIPSQEVGWSSAKISLTNPYLCCHFGSGFNGRFGDLDPAKHWDIPVSVVEAGVIALRLFTPQP